MSSTNKTAHLGLNSWLGSDVPKRTDFNADNALIDQALGEHLTDSQSHLTDQDRDRWNNYLYVATYYGNGTSSRTVDTKCPFEARFAIIFANNYPVARTRFDTEMNYNYFALATPATKTIGAALSDGKKLTVKQSTGSEVYDEYCNLNENGVVYTAMMFR